uniref:Basic leucine zipper ATF-like transcription factor n=1 Tax=Sinocyclocheilus rhinocerous TaxID=307959 RepID=A0A673FW94_9TELE
HTHSSEHTHTVNTHPEQWYKTDFSNSISWYINIISESENLEKENAALRKEVKRLTEEAKYLSTVLSNHEPLCTGLSGASTELLYGAHHGAFHQHISVPHYPL